MWLQDKLEDMLKTCDFGTTIETRRVDTRCRCHANYVYIIFDRVRSYRYVNSDKSHGRGCDFEFLVHPSTPCHMKHFERTACDCYRCYWFFMNKFTIRWSKFSDGKITPVVLLAIAVLIPSGFTHFQNAQSNKIVRDRMDFNLFWWSFGTNIYIMEF